MDIWTHIAISVFQDPGVDEVLMNGAVVTQVSNTHDTKSIPPFFLSDSDMQRALQELAHSQGLRLDPLSPAVGGLLRLDTFDVRWHALLPPIARDGPLLSMRRHRLGQLRLDDFCNMENHGRLRKTLSCGDRPVFIVGPTGSGKTSLLIALLQEIAGNDRVAILEQVPEIPKVMPQWIRLAAQAADVTGLGSFRLEQIFDELLRLRPDRIVIGELRQAEAIALKRAMLAGQGSVWCTLHTGGPESLFARLAELSGDKAEFWQKYLILQGAILCVTQKEKPRLREAWLLSNSGWSPIFCEAREK